MACPPAWRHRMPERFRRLSHKGLAGRLDDTRANRETACLHRGVAHPVTVSAEVGEFGRELRAPGMLVAKIGKRPDDFSHAVLALEEDVTVLLELTTRLRRVLSIRGIERGLHPVPVRNRSVKAITEMNVRYSGSAHAPAAGVIPAVCERRRERCENRAKDRDLCPWPQSRNHAIFEERTNANVPHMRQPATSTALQRTAWARCGSSSG